MDNKWKQLARKLVFDSKFVKVYEDTIQLPDGDVINDYTVVEKPNTVMVVATTRENKIIVLHEYKYAADEVLLTLPAGHVKKNEDPIGAALRELEEETGFTASAEDSELVGVLRDYPTKDLHTVSVVRIKNAAPTGAISHEETEQLTHTLLSKAELIKQFKAKKWKASSAIAALVIAEILI